MVETDGKQLEEMLAVCKALGAEVRYSPEGRYFTAMVWNGWGEPEKEQAALAIQKKFSVGLVSSPEWCAIALTLSAHWSMRSDYMK